MAKSDSWCSPPEIADLVEEFFGGAVDVDPCSNSHSVIRSRIAYTTGGLVLPWRTRTRPKRTVYENFPYSNGEVWTRKMLSELACGNVVEIIRLSMMATSSQWWADQCCVPARNPRILALRRVRFVNPFPKAGEDRDMTCRFEPALTYIGPRPARFVKTFAHLARWMTWGRT